MAIKSGRASLLLHIVLTVSALSSVSFRVDMKILKEMQEYYKTKQFETQQPSRATLITSHSSNEPPVQHTKAVKSSGIVLSFGKADHGKLGHGDVQLHRLVPTVIDTLKDADIIKLTSMSTYTVAISRSGSVYVWGTGGSAGVSQILKTEIQPQLLEALPVEAKVVDVSCGLGHALFLLDTGRVYSWGNGGNGRLGLGDLSDRTEACPVLISSSSNNPLSVVQELVVSVQCGASHSMVLTEKGAVYTWGKNTQGQCGLGNSDDVLRPSLVKKLEEIQVKKLAAGWEHSLVLTTEGKLFSWGCGYKDSRRGVVPPVLGLGHNECRVLPECITSIESVQVIDVVCGWDHCLALDHKGKVLSWGSGQNGKLGQGNEDNISIPCYIPFLESFAVVHLAAGCEHSAAVTDKGEMFSWGHGEGGRLGHGNNNQTFTPTKVETMELMGVIPHFVHCGDKFTMTIVSPLQKEVIKTTSKDSQPVEATEVEIKIRERFDRAEAELSKFFAPEVDITEGPSVESEAMNESSPAVLVSSTSNIVISSLNLSASKHSKLDEASLNILPATATPVPSSQLMTNLLYIMAQCSLTDVSDPSILNLLLRSKAAAAVSRRGFYFAADKEYAVECSDVTFSTILRIMDNLLAPYCSTLETFLHSVLSFRYNEDLSDKSGAIKGKPMSIDLTREALEQFLELNHEEISLLRSSFEPLFCLFMIFAANLEVLTERLVVLNGRFDGEPKRKRKLGGRFIAKELSALHRADFTAGGPDGSPSGSGFGGVEGENENSKGSESDGDGGSSGVKEDSETEFSLGGSDSVGYRDPFRSSIGSRGRSQTVTSYLEADGGEDYGSMFGSSFQGAEQMQHQDLSDSELNMMYPDDKSSNGGEDNSFYSQQEQLRFQQEHSHQNVDKIEREFSNDTRSKLGSGRSGYASESRTDALEDSFKTTDFSQYDPDGSYSDGSPLMEQTNDRRNSDVNDVDLYGAYESPRSSPAPSYQSLGVDPRNEDEDYGSSRSGSDFEPPHNSLIRDKGSPRGRVKRQHSSRERENVELQRAILSSIAHNPTEQVKGRFAGNVSTIGRVILPADNEEPSIPLARDMMNSLASQCYVAVESLYGFNPVGSPMPSPVRKGHPSAAVDGKAPALQKSKDLEEIGELVFSLWETVQTVTTRGFQVLYCTADQRTVFCQVIQSPSSFLYLFPGLIQGAERSKSLRGLVASILPSVEVLCGEGTQTPGYSEKRPRADVLSLDDLISFLQFLYSRITLGFEQETQDPSIVSSVSVSKMFSVVQSAMIKLLQFILMELFSRILMIKSDLLFDQLNDKKFPWGDKINSLLSLLTDCAVTEIEASNQADDGKSKSVQDQGDGSFCTQVVARLFEIFGTNFSVDQTVAVLPHALRLIEAYGSLKAVSAALEQSFHWVLYFVAASVQLLMLPPVSLQPSDLRSTLTRCCKVLSMSESAAGAFEKSRAHQLWNAIGTFTNVKGYYDSASAVGKGDSQLSEDFEQGNCFILFDEKSMSYHADFVLINAYIFDSFAPLNVLQDAEFWKTVGFLQDRRENTGNSYSYTLDLYKAFNNTQYSTLLKSLQSEGLMQSVDKVNPVIQLQFNIFCLFMKGSKQLVKCQTLSKVIQNYYSAAHSGLKINPALLQGEDGTLILAIWLSSIFFSLLFVDYAVRCDPYGRDRILRQITQKCLKLLSKPYPIVTALVVNAAEIAIPLKQSLSGPQTVDMKSVHTLSKWMLQRFRSVAKQMISELAESNLNGPGEAHADLILGKTLKTVLPTEEKVPAINETGVSLSLLLNFATLAVSSTPIEDLELLCLWERAKDRNHVLSLSVAGFTMYHLQHCRAAAKYFADCLQAHFSEKVPHQRTKNSLTDLSSRYIGLTVSSKISQERVSKPKNNNLLLYQDITSKLNTVMGKELLLVLEQLRLDHAGNRGVSESLLEQTRGLLLIPRLLILQLRRSSSLRSEKTVIGLFTLLETIKAFSAPLAELPVTLWDSKGSVATPVRSTQNLLNALRSTLLCLQQLLDCGVSFADEMAVGRTKAENESSPSTTSRSQRPVHQLCSIFPSISGLLESLAFEFQRHLRFCRSVGLQYLYPSVCAIDYCSPTIVPNVFTSQGNFSVGFWLFFPSSLLQTYSKDGSSSFHLLSRVTETGDSNLVNLLSALDEQEKSPTEKDSSSFTIRTLCTEDAAFLTLDVYLLDTGTTSRSTLNSSVAARTKAKKVVKLKSGVLPFDQWLCCVVEWTQDSVEIERELGRDRNKKSDSMTARRQDVTTVAMFLDGVLQQHVETVGGKTPLHQNMVIGKMPSHLGTSGNKDDQLRLADVFWIPTSVCVSSSSVEYAEISNFLSGQSLRGEAVESSKKTTITSNILSKLLPSCPPCMLTETLDLTNHCALHLLDCLFRLFGGKSDAPDGHERTDTSAKSSIVMLVPALCDFIMKMIRLGSCTTQSAAFRTLLVVLSVLPHSNVNSVAELPDHRQSLDGSLSLENSFDTLTPSKRLLKSASGSAVNVAAVQKGFTAFRQSLLECLEIVSSLITQPPLTPVSDSDVSSSKQMWLERLKLTRLSVERNLRVLDWGALIVVDESSIINGVSALSCLALEHGLIDGSFFSEHDGNLSPEASDLQEMSRTFNPSNTTEAEASPIFSQSAPLSLLPSADTPIPTVKSTPLLLAKSLVMMVCAGGWAPTISSGHQLVEFSPRKLFLFADPLVSEVCAFPGTAKTVMNALTPTASSRAAASSLVIEKCDASFQRVPVGRITTTNPTIQQLKSLIPCKQHSSAFCTEMVNTHDAFQIATLRSLGDTYGAATVKNGPALLDLLKKTVFALKGRNGKKTRSFRCKSPTDGNPENSQPQLIQDTNFLELIQQMTFLRSLLVQAMALNSPSSDSNVDEATQLQQFFQLVSHNFSNILTVAVMDPVQMVTGALNVGASKGVQLDVLRNLLKEGDVPFLEKIALRMWKQFKFDVNSSLETRYGVSSTLGSLVQLSSLAGEVAIAGSKVRALSHFPSVRLLGVSLERMTGRWFYECTLLSDGLMQIGWANVLFRCDPVCGQGVGDHMHSWAYDGLRTKKWNVSCEAYGRRWRLGDTIGALMDMDLMEMRFFLNGEDLGAAFDDLSDYQIFPAFSLNVRQCVRLNFGQYKFLYPPDELDGKPYKPVIAALVSKQTNSSNIKPNQIAVKAKLSSSNDQNDNLNEGAKDAPTGSIEETSAVDPPPRQSSFVGHNITPAGGNTASRYDYSEDVDQNEVTPDRPSHSVSSSAEGDTDQPTERPIYLPPRWGNEEEEDADDDDDEDDEEEDEEDQEEEEEEEEDATDREEQMRERLDSLRRARMRNAAEEETAEAEENSHLTELRRQAMIESLIGMGFPVDWALRAAEHCDVSASESAAITWIIERMELEQNKMDEMEDGDSSRVGDEEDFEEAEDTGLEFFMQRHSAAFAMGDSNASEGNATGGNSVAGQNTSQTSPGGTVSGTLRLAAISRNITETELGEGGNGGVASTVSSAAANGSSPLREELLGLRRGLITAADLRIAAITGKDVSATTATSTGKSARMDAEAGKISAQINDSAMVAAPWNAIFRFPPVLVGHYTARRRHDQDKQEVINQVAELDLTDMLPIIASCEFALCIYYARALLVRSFNMFASSLFAKNRNPRLTLSRPSVFNEQISSELGLVNSSSFGFLGQLLLQSDSNYVISFLRCCFKQHVVSIGQPDRLFPLIASGNATGEMRDRVPPLVPFVSANQLLFCSLLTEYEDQLFPRIKGCRATEESSLQGLVVLKDVLDSVLFYSYNLSNADVKAQNAEDSHLNSSSISSNLSDLQGHHLRDLGVDMGDLPFDQKFSIVCQGVITSLVESALSILETASSSSYDGHDWLLGCMDRSESTAYGGVSSDANSSLTPVQLQQIQAPPLLFAYWVLRRLLVSVMLDCDRSSYLRVLSEYSSKSEDYLGKGKPLGRLISAESLSWLLKLSSSQNLSFRFCVYDLCSLVLSVVNVRLHRLKQNAGVEVFDNSIRQHQYEVRRTQLQMAAAEYYITIAKEKKLLQLLGLSLKCEGMEPYRLYSRFTRVIGGFLFQWHLLRRLLGLSSINYLHQYMLSSLTLSYPLPARIGSIEEKRELDPPTQEFLQVTQVSSTSVTVSWTLEPFVVEGGGSTAFDANLFFTAASHMGLESPLMVLSRIESRGVYRIDDLEPDTLYKVNISKIPLSLGSPMKVGSSRKIDQQSSPEGSKQNSPAKKTYYPNFDGDEASPEATPTTDRISFVPFSESLSLSVSKNPAIAAETQVKPRFEDLSVFVATECEAAFRFDVDQISPNIVLTNHSPLTLRNQANKKWSSARASVRMVSGMHRWDIHIDRCVSKNIFIGVASRDARLDNYIGCDKHGWAFLANKAIWHGKSKLKPYGDLFRTGDTVTVSLDLDQGTMSYALNDKPLGVAVEGLSGPLYPAFSLYNEDDQVTVVQVRTMSDPSSAAGSYVAEKMLERVDILGCMLNFVAESPVSFESIAGEGPSQDGNPSEDGSVGERNESVSMSCNILPDELLREMLTRWDLWKHDVGMRSFLVGCEFITIQQSQRACDVISERRVSLGELVMVEKQAARALGVACHKIWFRNEESGEVFGLTSDAIAHLVLGGSLYPCDSLHEASLNSIDAWPSQVHAITRVRKATDAEEAICLLQFAESIESLRFGLAVLQQKKWNKTHDETLLRTLEMVTRMQTVTDPFSVSLFALWKFLKKAEDYTGVHAAGTLARPPSALDEKEETTYIDEDSAYYSVKTLLRDFSLEGLLLRALLLIHLNDLVLPLLPMVAPQSNAVERVGKFSEQESPSKEGNTDKNNSDTDEKFSSINGEMGVNHPANKLKHARSLLFSSVKASFAQCLSHLPPSTAPALLAPVYGYRANLVEQGPSPAADGTVSASTPTDGGASSSVVESTPYSTGGAMLQSILNSLGEEARRYLEMEGISAAPPDRKSGSSAAGASTVGGTPTNVLLTPPFHTMQVSIASNSPLSSALKDSTNQQSQAEEDLRANHISCISGGFSAKLQSPPLVLEVRSELALSRQVLSAAKERSVSQTLLKDRRWAFLTGLQSSYVGQMMKFFEQLASLNAFSKRPLDPWLRAQNPQAAKLHQQQMKQMQQYHLKASGWEQSLRVCAAKGLNLLWGSRDLSPADRATPFLVRPFFDGFLSLKDGESGTQLNARRLGKGELSAADEVSLLFRWFLIAQKNPECVSDFVLFAVFVEEACDQIMRLVKSVFSSSVIDQKDGIELNYHPDTAGELSLFLQTFHAVGVLLGLAFRSGAPVVLPLPHPFLRILANENQTEFITSTPIEKINTNLSQQGNKKTESEAYRLLHTSALALRTGICSIFPESALDLLTKEEWARLLNGGWKQSALRIRRTATYLSPLTPYDNHIQYFWAALYELSLGEMTSFLRILLGLCKIGTINTIKPSEVLETSARSLQSTSESSIKVETSSKKSSVIREESTREMMTERTLNEKEKHQLHGFFLDELLYDENTAEFEGLNGFSNDIGGGKNGIVICIAPPTAVALLSPDSSELNPMFGSYYQTQNPSHKGSYVELQISVPRYSGLKIAKQQLAGFLNTNRSVGK